LNFSNSTMDHHNVKLAMHAGQMWLFSGGISYACQRSLERVPVPQMATCLLGVKRHQTGLFPLQRLCGSTGCDADADCDIVGGHHRHIHNNDNWSEVTLSWRPRRWHTTCLWRLPKRKHGGMPVVMATWQGEWKDTGESGRKQAGKVEPTTHLTGRGHFGQELFNNKICITPVQSLETKIESLWKK